MNIQRLGVVLTLGMALGAACGDKGGGGETGDVGDGGTADGGADGGDGGSDVCAATLKDTDPEDGETDIYYRDPIELDFDGDGRAAVISLVTEAGSVDIGDQAVWEADGLNAKITVEGGLEPSTDYTLRVDCAEVEEVQFTTAAYGEPAAFDPADLVGNTYLLDLPGAKFVQPPGLGALLGLFLDQPILIGVTDADAATIDTLGAPGAQQSDGSYKQDKSQSTWDFPVADFTSAPYFATDATDIEITYDDDGDIYAIPIYGFEFEGTFAADGSSIGGGKAYGQGDTRELGPLLNLGDDPGALCDYVSGFGLECEACPGGGAYCMTIEAWFDPGLLLDGIALEEI